MPARAEAEDIYSAVWQWAQNCLLREKSVFTSQPIWTAENLRRLNTDFVENLLTDERSFLDKLREQLGSSPHEVKWLAVEMLWLMMLFPSNISYDTKVRVVVAPLLGGSLPVGPMLELLARGVGSTGQAYNQHRWRELALLIRAMIAWGDLSQKDRRTLLDDGWGFAAWLDGIPDANKRQIRNILLHLLFPDLFEPISSFQHKRLIVRHFGRALEIPHPRESISLPVDAFDRPLNVIRARLEEMYPGRAVGFYDPVLEFQWRKREGGTGDGDSQDARGREPDPLEKRLQASLRRIVKIHVKLTEAIPELRPRPTLSVLASALIRSLEENRRDTARALWDQINRQDLPDDANAVLLMFRLPYDRVDESVYSSPDGVDVNALLGSKAGHRLRAILLRAEDCAREVTGQASPKIYLRHLIAAILRPGAMNEAKRALIERECWPDRLRAGLMEFFRAELVADDFKAWREYLDVDEPVPLLPEPGYARDYIDPEQKEVTPDHLNVDPDVQALARLLCARQAEPPLSVGLFGDWGTGKSTFMQRLKWNIGMLSERAEQAETRGVSTAYQSGVVSIWFNAWHYMDANLWASLVTRIFDRLAEHLSGGAPTLEQVRKTLYGRLAASQGLLSEAEGRKKLASAAVGAAQERLDTARRQETEVARRIARARDVAAGLWTAITSEAEPETPPTAPTDGATLEGPPPADSAPEDEAAKAADAALASAAEQVRTSVAAAAKELGLPQARATVGEIRGALAQMRGMWGSMLASVEILHRQKGRLRDLVLLLLAGVVLTAIVVPAVLLLRRGQMGAWIATATGFLVSLLPLLSVLGAVAAKVRRVLERADAEIRASTERATAQADALQHELERLKAAAAAAERDRMLAHQTVEQIEAEIEDIKAGRRLEKFIRDRAGSDDYRRHLGIIATIRSDFEALAALLDQVRSESARAAVAKGDGSARGEPALAATHPVRRIVLYIDDLDRCPEERVVEVLQAVHLLLAFPLFVVVVGVDSRWLLRAVQSQYERLLTSERDTARAGVPVEDAARWASTPQNYLEKIFQIPFTLEPMGGDGFGRLLGSLLKVRAQPEPAKPEGEPPPEAREAEGDAETADTASPSSELDEEWLNDESEDEEDPPEEEDDDAGLNPPGLEIEQWELDHMSALAPLIGSPRMAKRFANVYRFIRAALSGPELDTFSGTAEQPGEFRAVSLLLALLTGFPGEAVELFRGLIEEDPIPGEDWPKFVHRVAERTAAATAPAPGAGLPARRWARLAEAMEQVGLDDRVSIPTQLEPYRKWAPRVARFSFQTVQLVARRPSPSSPGPPAPADAGEQVVRTQAG